MRNDIEASKNKSDRENLKKQRNEIMNKIHQRKSKIEREKITEKIEEIENHKEDSNRMYQVVRQGQWLISLDSWHQIRQGLWSELYFYHLLYCTSPGHLCEIECTQLFIITSHAMHENTKFHHKQKSETMNLIKFSDIDLH